MHTVIISSMKPDGMHANNFRKFFMAWLINWLNFSRIMDQWFHARITVSIARFICLISKVISSRIL